MLKHDINSIVYLICKKQKGSGDIVQELLALVIVFGFSAMVAIAMLVAAFVVSPKADSNVKCMNYESGMEPFSDSRVQYRVSFFMYAILFLIFDVETILLFPFAVIFNKLGLLALGEVSIFLLLLLLALVYAARKNMLRFR